MAFVLREYQDEAMVEENTGAARARGGCEEVAEGEWIIGAMFDQRTGVDSKGARIGWEGW